MADQRKPRKTRRKLSMLVDFGHPKCFCCAMQSKQAKKVSDWLTTGEAAEIALVSVDTLKRWEKAGRISSLRTPTGHRRFKRKDVERLLQPGHRHEVA